MADSGLQRSFPLPSRRDFYNVLFRHKRKMIFFFLGVFLVVALGTFLGSRVYRSEAELLVRLGRENATVGPTVATGRVININADRETEINSEVDILKSQELAEEVVEAVGAKRILHGAKETLAPDASAPTVVRFYIRRAVEYPFELISHLLFLEGRATPHSRLLQKDLATEALGKRLDVEASKKSNIITITYETNDPALARNVLNRLVGFYVQKHIEVNRTPGSYTFFKEQKAKLQSSLDRTEEELRELKNRSSVASVSEQRRLILDRIGAMKRELAHIQSSSAATTARVKALTATLARLPGTVQKNEITGFASSAADEMRKRVYELELEEQKLLSTYTPNSIPVREIRRRIQQGRALLVKAQQQNQVTTGINENYQKIQLDLVTEKAKLASLKARAKAIRAQLEGAREEMVSLNGTQLRFERLERDLATQKSSYRKYSDSLEQARIDEALDVQRISNISIVEPATYTIKPVRPKAFVNLALGFFLGIFGALGLAFFSEFQDDSFQKPEDVASRLRLPVLAALPVASPGLTLGESNPLPEAEGRERLLGAGENGSAFGDLLRVCGQGGAADLHAIALVGCHSGEGVSTAAALLATQLAKSGGGRVLLIDANSVSPCQHVKFGTSLSPGLNDFETDGLFDLSCIQPAAVKNLDVLSAGAGGRELSPNGVKAFCDALPALRQEYTVIICDLPPVLEQSPARRIAAMMDGVVLVVEAEKTRSEVANKAREALLQADSNIIGIILNKRQFHIPEWLYKTL